MQLKIGENIKRLRRKNGMTQERLAEMLGVSYVAVSKWESASTCPDISLLIPLSEIFNVSVDELLGNKKSERAVRLEEVKATLKHTQYDDSLPDSTYLDFARQAVAEFPADEYLQHELAWALKCRVYFASDLDGETKNNLADEAEKILAQLIDTTTDETMRCRASYTLVELYADCKKDAKRALETANRLPEMEWCRELVKADAFSGGGNGECDLSARCQQEAILVLAENLCGKIAALSQYATEGDDEIAMRVTSNRIYELIYGSDIKWNDLLGGVAGNHLAIARAQAAMGKDADALASLEEMCRCAELAAERFKAGGTQYQSIFLDRLAYKSEGDEVCEENIFRNQLGYRLNGLENKSFDSIRSDDRFCSVLARLETLLKSRKD